MGWVNRYFGFNSVGIALAVCLLLISAPAKSGFREEFKREAVRLVARNLFIWIEGMQVKSSGDTTKALMREHFADPIGEGNKPTLVNIDIAKNRTGQSWRMLALSASVGAPT